MFRSIFKTIFRGLVGTAHEPPEDGLKNESKHVGHVLSVFNVSFRAF
jgi:hypothetical protein